MFAFLEELVQKLSFSLTSLLPGARMEPKFGAIIGQALGSTLGSLDTRWSPMLVAV